MNGNVPPCRGGTCDNLACDLKTGCLYKSSAEEARELQETRERAYQQIIQNGKGVEFPANADSGDQGDVPAVSVSATNPKDFLGIKKVPAFSVIPPASLIYEALAMRYGAHLAPKADDSLGYGPYNWRENKVVASIYVDACVRHLMAYWDGEDDASDSHVPHLGHAKACLGILADAIESGNLVDDRPTPGPAASLLDRFRNFFVPQEGR